MKILPMSTCMNKSKQLLDLIFALYLPNRMVFKKQTKLTTDLETVEVNEMNKCLSKS